MSGKFDGIEEAIRRLADAYRARAIAKIDPGSVAVGRAEIGSGSHQCVLVGGPYDGVVWLSDYAPPEIVFPVVSRATAWVSDDAMYLEYTPPRLVYRRTATWTTHDKTHRYELVR